MRLCENGRRIAEYGVEAQHDVPTKTSVRRTDSRILDRRMTKYLIRLIKSSIIALFCRGYFAVILSFRWHLFQIFRHPMPDNQIGNVRRQIIVVPAEIIVI